MTLIVACKGNGFVAIGGDTLSYHNGVGLDNFPMTGDKIRQSHSGNHYVAISGTTNVWIDGKLITRSLEDLLNPSELMRQEGDHPTLAPHSNFNYLIVDPVNLELYSGANFKMIQQHVPGGRGMIGHIYKENGSPNEILDLFNSIGIDELKTPEMAAETILRIIQYGEQLYPDKIRGATVYIFTPDTKQNYYRRVPTRAEIES